MKIERHGSIVVPELEEAAIESGRTKHWTDEEEAVMRKYYPALAKNGKLSELAKHLKRTLGSVGNKASDMGLKRAQSRAEKK